MNISEVVSIARRVHDAESMNWGPTSTRNGRNADWLRIIGIVHHGHPNYNRTPDPQWHAKDAGGGRPQSDDAIVSMPSRTSYDCVLGTGGPNYSFIDNPHGEVLGPEQNVWAPPVPPGSGGVAPSVPVSDLWTAAHQAIRARMPSASTQMIAEQMAYSFPHQRWGQKRADPGRPVSGDVIALDHDGRLYGVRVVPVTAGAPFDITGQTFVAVSAVNHLAEPVPEPEPNPTPVPTPPAQTLLLTDIAALIAPLAASVVAQSALIEALRSEQGAIHEQLAAGFDIDAKAPYLGKITGTVRPKARE